MAEALRHAAWAEGAEAEIAWIDAEELEKPGRRARSSVLDGIIVPGGFGCGERRDVRRGAVPAEAACAAFRHLPRDADGCHRVRARDAAGAKGAIRASSTREPHKVIDFMPGQSESLDKGQDAAPGRLPCPVMPGTTLARCCGRRRSGSATATAMSSRTTLPGAPRVEGSAPERLSPDGRLVEAVELRRPSASSWGSVPPGVQVPPEPAPPRSSRVPSARRSALSAWTRQSRRPRAARRGLRRPARTPRSGDMVSQSGRG